MNTIGLVAAMPLERNALLHLIKGRKRITLGSFLTHCFEFSGWDCVLITSGMGIQHAKQAAKIIVETVHPRILISFGIAGAVEADLKIGDVVEATKVCVLDQGKIETCQSISPLSEAAREAVICALAEIGAHLFSGTAITTGGSQLNEIQPGTFPHPILEMETAGIAQVTSDHGIPLLSLRAISDGPIAPIPMELGEIMDKDANLHPGRMLKAIVRHPKVLLQGIKTIRNSRVAADNSALAVISVISKLSIV
jgi:nucleoside phosphorylase